MIAVGKGISELVLIFSDQYLSVFNNFLFTINWSTNCMYESETLNPEVMLSMDGLGLNCYIHGNIHN